MRKGADDIWNNYLDTSAMHQINVDNKARSHCKEALQNPNNTMFEMAQNQVYMQGKLLQQLRLLVAIFTCFFSLSLLLGNSTTVRIESNINNNYIL